MKVVKSDNVLKLQWGTIRRQITPKINQLTQDSASITRIVRHSPLCMTSLTPSSPDQPNLRADLSTARYLTPTVSGLTFVLGKGHPAASRDRSDREEEKRCSSGARHRESFRKVTRIS